MSGTDNSERRALRVRLLLAAVGGVAAGASRAVVTWVLSHLAWT